MRLRHLTQAAAEPERALQGEQDQPGQRELVVVGAHGGAGASTLAALLKPAWDMGPITGLMGPGFPTVQPKGRPLVLVCRSTAAGAKAALGAVTWLDASRLRIAALVIVSDGMGPEPKRAAARFALLERRVGGMVRMPFIQDLRLVDDPAEVTPFLSSRAWRALVQIRNLADG